MNYLVRVFFVFVLINIVSCEKCSMKNFDVVWYRTRLDEVKYSRILAENLEDARIIEIVPNQTVTIICEGTIKDLDNLHDLTLNSSGIQEVQPGSFKNVYGLFKLDLSGNNLERIASGVFNGLKLRILNLNNNKIKQIDATAFNDMDKLKIIDLSYNKIQEINADWFKKTINVIHLILEKNNIKALNARTFKNLKRRGNISHSDDILNIHLGDNEIDFVHPQAFDDLEELNSLYLHNNKIKTLDKDTFTTLNRIKRLDLMINEIECFPVKLLLKVDEVLLNSNPWNCTCLSDLKKWASKHNVNVGISIEWLKCLVEDLKSIQF